MVPVTLALIYCSVYHIIIKISTFKLRRVLKGHALFFLV